MVVVTTGLVVGGIVTTGPPGVVVMVTTGGAMTPPGVEDVEVVGRVDETVELTVGPEVVELTRELELTGTLELDCWVEDDEAGGVETEELAGADDELETGADELDGGADDELTADEVGEDEVV